MLRYMTIGLHLLFNVHFSQTKRMYKKEKKFATVNSELGQVSGVTGNHRNTSKGDGQLYSYQSVEIPVQTKF